MVHFGPLVPFKVELCIMLNVWLKIMNFVWKYAKLFSISEWLKQIFSEWFLNIRWTLYAVFYNLIFSLLQTPIFSQILMVEYPGWFSSDPYPYILFFQSNWNFLWKFQKQFSRLEAQYGIKLKILHVISVLNFKGWLARVPSLVYNWFSADYISMYFTIKIMNPLITFLINSW